MSKSFQKPLVKHKWLGDGILHAYVGYQHMEKFKLKVLSLFPFLVMKEELIINNLHVEDWQQIPLLSLQ